MDQIIRPGDKLSRAIATNNLLMLSRDGARELAMAILRELEHPTHNIPTDGEGHCTAVSVDNLDVCIYDEKTPQESVARVMAQQHLAGAVEFAAALSADQAIATREIRRQAANN